MQSVYKLKGVVQHYSWGGTDFIPELLSREKDGKPYAEYWIGAHPKCSSNLVNGKEISLCDAIDEKPIEFLGEKLHRQFGSLPYLFKILDVKQMLSIQVHPSKKGAAAGYAEEEERGISLAAGNRNYKDQNHKPELMVALSEFWLLHGFKEDEEMLKLFRELEVFSPLKQAYLQGGYKQLYEKVMKMPQQETDMILKPLMDEILPKYRSGRLKKSEPHFWAARAAETFCKDECYDRGIFSIYFFNLLKLEEGEAIFQPAGLPHAYLEGQNVEVMANSDNVLRAGLTEKHIDEAELMKHVNFEATAPKVIAAGEGRVTEYETPAEEFRLKKLALKGSTDLEFEHPAIVFNYEGSTILTASDFMLELHKGEAAYLLPGAAVHLQTVSHSACIFLVTVP